MDSNSSLNAAAQRGILALAWLLAGCSARPLPATAPMVVDKGAELGPIAVIHGSLTRAGLSPDRRARIVALDDRKIESPLGDLPQIVAKPGRHNLAVVCDRPNDTASARNVTLALEAVAAHRYQIRCAPEIEVIGVGMSAWIEDETENNRIVVKVALSDPN